MPHGGVLQAQGVSDLMGGHHEQVVALVSVQRPSLRHVEVGFSSARQEGMSQGPTWMSHIYCLSNNIHTYIFIHFKSNCYICTLSGCEADLVRQKRYWRRRCGPPHKKPAGCLRGPRGPPGTPGQTHYSTAGKQCAPPVAQRPETGGEASSLSGRSADACTTSQLQNKARKSKKIWMMVTWNQTHLK